MNPFPNRSALQSAVLGLIVLGLIAMALGGYLAPLSRYALAPILSAQTWLTNRYQAISAYVSAPADMTRLRQRNQQLEAQVAQLESQIIELQQQLSETRILSALVNFEHKYPDNRYIAASVIGRDPNPFLQYVIINRGSDDGLRRGMPVVSSQGLVGRIAAVTANAAKVQLITDPSSIVNARLDRTDAQAVLEGQITGEVRLEQIPQAAKIEVGDLVMTSGLGGSYPEDLLIGQITSIRRRDYDIFQSAAVQPVVDFSKLDIVLVITNFRPIDIAPLVSTPSP